MAEETTPKHVTYEDAGVDTAEGAYTIRFDALPTPRVLSFRTPLEQA